LDCAISNEESRVAKVATYGADPVRPEGLGPELFYLPERYATGNPLPVPSEDLDAINRVVGAQVERGMLPNSLELSFAGRAEIDRHWDRRALAPDAYRGSLTILEADIHVPMGWDREIFVRVTNLGSEVWPGGEDRHPLIRLGYRWLGTNGSDAAAKGGRSTFAASLPRGGSCLVPLMVTAPNEPGVYVLEVDLVHEAVRWFGCPEQTRVTVSQNPPQWFTELQR
jgi:hypothetical protein